MQRHDHVRHGCSIAGLREWAANKCPCKLAALQLPALDYSCKTKLLLRVFDACVVTAMPYSELTEAQHANMRKVRK